MNEEKKDNFNTRLVIGIILGLLLVLFSAKSETNSRFEMADDEVSTIISQTNEAFDLAEEKILGVKPTPDDTPSGPDPDPDKCICGGTGKITHGDGHQTDCPYHAKKKP